MYSAIIEFYQLANSTSISIIYIFFFFYCRSKTEWYFVCLYCVLEISLSNRSQSQQPIIACMSNNFPLGMNKNIDCNLTVNHDHRSAVGLDCCGPPVGILEQDAMPYPPPHHHHHHYLHVNHVAQAYHRKKSI